MRKFLFIFMFIILLVPFQVKALEDVNLDTAGGYVSSIRNGIYYFEFGNGKTLSFPFEVRIKDIFFNFLDIIETDIPKEELKIEYDFELEKLGNDSGIARILYKDSVISHRVYTSIPQYIYIDKEIIINNYEFDIWTFIKTNIKNKEQIQIIGEYDLNTNGKYALLIKYNEIIENTILTVDIENNKEVLDCTCPKEEIKENTCEQNNEKVLTYETKNYISNYYTYNTENPSECSCEIKQIPVPINRVVYTNDCDFNKIFYYISYSFYLLVIILLSIFVVRKK